MKQKIKVVVLLFFVSLVIVPGFIYGVSHQASLTASKIDANEKILTKIVATPSSVSMKQGSDEQEFRTLIKVEAYYKNQKEPAVITDYTTNFNTIKDKTGSRRVDIKYTENGCTKKTSVCVDLTKVVEPETTAKPDEDINDPYIFGYTDGTFRPEQAVTREELAAMLARLITKNKIPEEENVFKDLPSGRFSTDAINYITKLGIMEPVTKDTFNPNGIVSNKEFDEIVDRMGEYIKNKEVQLSKDKGNLSRVQAVVALNKLFKVRCNDLVEENRFTDVTPQTPYYQDILCATQSRKRA